MTRSLNENTPPWIKVSRAFLSLLAGGEGDISSLRACLLDLVKVAEETETPVPPDRDPPELPKMSLRHWSDIAERRFPSLQDYDQGRGEVGFAADDIGDIAHDLDEAVRTFEAGDAENALWEWRFGFETHWGEHHARPLLRHLEKQLRD